MQFILIPLIAFVVSGLSLFSGFGVSTLLVPAFVFFFPIEVAVALAALVHFLNNLFKLALVGKHADLKVVLTFGLPALLASLLGAQLLFLVATLPNLANYQLGPQHHAIMPIKLLIALLMIGFALLEIVPRFKHLSFPNKYMPLGGILSGFFGGLSGNQGALRSAFLIKSNLSKNAFIATGIAIAVFVDIPRLTVYATHLKSTSVQQNASLLVYTTLAAFLGAFLASRLLKKTTFKTVQLVVAVVLLGIAVLLGSGLI